MTCVARKIPRLNTRIRIPPLGWHDQEENTLQSLHRNARKETRLASASQHRSETPRSLNVPSGRAPNPRLGLGDVAPQRRLGNETFQFLLPSSTFHGMIAALRPAIAITRAKIIPMIRNIPTDWAPDSPGGPKARVLFALENPLPGVLLLYFEIRLVQNAMHVCTTLYQGESKTYIYNEWRPKNKS